MMFGYVMAGVGILLFVYAMVTLHKVHAQVVERTGINPRKNDDI